MNKIKATIFDVDGVMIIPPEMFSRVYAEKYGVNPGHYRSFLSTIFRKHWLARRI